MRASHSEQIELNLSLSLLLLLPSPLSTDWEESMARSGSRLHVVMATQTLVFHALRPLRIVKDFRLFLYITWTVYSKSDAAQKKNKAQQIWHCKKESTINKIKLQPHTLTCIFPVGLICFEEPWGFYETSLLRKNIFIIIQYCNKLVTLKGNWSTL